MSFSFWANLVISVASLSSTWLNHADLLAEIREEADARKKIRKKWGLGLLWFVTVSSLLSLPFTAWESVSSENRVTEIEKKAVKNNPLSQPVSEISASVVVKLAGTNFARFSDPFDLRLDNWIMLLETKTNEAAFNSGSIRSLMANDVLPFVHQRQLNEAAVSHGYVMKYIENPLDAFDRKSQLHEPRPTAKEVLEKVKVLRISPKFIPVETKVIGGEVVLTINGTIRKKFIIYPQEADKDFLEWSPNFKSLVFLATNSNPVSY